MKTFTTHLLRRLLDHALDDPFDNLTNNFAKPKLLKNRIAMLYKNKNSNWALGKYLAILPLVGLMVLLTAAHERSAETLVIRIPIAEAIAPAVRIIEIPKLKNKPTELILMAEETTVTGVVKNAQDGKPLEGTTVVLVGTGQGVSTDADGKFELKNVPLKSALAVSFVGYVTQQIDVTQSNQALKIAMQRDRVALESVVVVGYTTTRAGEPVSAPKPAAITNENGTFTVVEQLPEYPGGTQEMYKYLGKNIRYPSDASRDNVQGKVVITFTVNDKGRIRNPKVVQSVGYGIDEEALRVVLSMPSWNPGKQNGRPVDMEYVLPIEFMLE